VKSLFIDLTLTQQCNFRCKYCFESGHFKSRKLYETITLDALYSFINELVKKFRIDRVTFGMWGGEPLLEIDYMLDIIKQFENEPWFYKTFVFTNGYLIDSVLDKLSTVKDKIWIQVSYDGKVIHDKYRKSIDHQLTSDRVLHNYKLLVKHNFECSIKSVLPVSDIHNLVEVYKEFESLNETYLTKFNKSLIYNPSFDYYSLYDWSEIENKLKQALKNLIGYLKHKERIYISWFQPRPKRAICSLGSSMIAIDVNGFIHPCHGFIYYKDHKFKTHIFDHNVFDKLELMFNFFSQKNKYEPAECKSCTVNFCMRCNASFYSLSKKTSDYERLWDKDSTIWLCKTYKLIDKAYRALKHYKSITR